MARRFQEITEVYRQELAALARGDKWTAFLRSACRNYKLHFEEQVLVHAQRPDATAVLEMEHWNRRFDRWVDPGSTGIAVFDRDTPGRARLKYYFDISDTHEGRFHRPVPLWQVSAEQKPEIVEALEHRFGALAQKETLGDAIVSAMGNAVTDNMADYLADLQQSRDGSFLEELDELNVKVLYRRLLENSTAYMLLCRCGLEPDAYFEPEDFSEVFNFNTPETMNALGVELAPEGSGYRPKTRFAKFFNLPELMATFKMVADVQTADMLNLPVPKANFHTEVIQPNELQRAVVAELAERAERVRARAVDPSTDNMLRITNDGRKLALDMRLINPLAADDPNGKVATCARNVARIWAQTKDQRSTQLVFCDLSTPNKNTPIEMQKNAEGIYEMIPDQFTDVYNDLKKKLVAEGIPEEEIAFIHDAKTEQKKKELFAKVRGGEVRILMGSTAKMGAGTNVQDRLIALHDLDCPWRPSDLQQRLGRIVRQGNQNPEVEIFRYVTEGTFDAYLYQLVESKQRFIAQIMTSKLPARAAEDVDETALSYAEIKALATGNPQIIEKCNLDMEVSKLNMLRASHLSQRYALEELVLRKYPAEIKELNERIAGYEQDNARLAEHPKPAEGIAPMILNGVTYAEREDAGKAIIHVCTHMNGAGTVPVGSYRGFDMALSYDSKTNEFHMTLKGSLSHTAVLGADAGGNVTRIDNALEKINERLENARSQLAHATEQLENARTEMTAPFPREAELAEKTRRLNELNVLLNLNEPDRVVMSEEPDEGGSPRPRTADRER